jgi:hypothetical protein
VQEANRAQSLVTARGRPDASADGTPVVPEFFSARVSCHVFQRLEFGADLGSRCLG